MISVPTFVVSDPVPSCGFRSVSLLPFAIFGFPYSPSFFAREGHTVTSDLLVVPLVLKLRVHIEFGSSDGELTMMALSSDRRKLLFAS